MLQCEKYLFHILMKFDKNGHGDCSMSCEKPRQLEANLPLENATQHVPLSPKQNRLCSRAVVNLKYLSVKSTWVKKLPPTTILYYKTGVTKNCQFTARKRNATCTVVFKAKQARLPSCCKFEIFFCQINTGQKLLTTRLVQELV